MENCEITLAINAIAIAISKGKTPIELLNLARLFTLLSANLSVLAIIPPVTEDIKDLKTR